jgi:hypothetical protein
MFIPIQACEDTNDFFLKKNYVSWVVANSMMNLSVASESATETQDTELYNSLPDILGRLLYTYLHLPLGPNELRG